LTAHLSRDALRLPAAELGKLFLGINRMVFRTTKAMPDGYIRAANYSRFSRKATEHHIAKRYLDVRTIPQAVSIRKTSADRAWKLAP
jgi:hypothetical protein